MQFDIATGGLFLFGENGTDGIRFDPSLRKVLGSNNGDFLDLDGGIWQTNSVNMRIDPDVGSNATFFLGGSGDNDIINIIYRLGIGDATPDAAFEILSSTSPQLIVSNTDNIDDFRISVDSNGDVTFASTGLDVIWSDTLNLAGGGLKLPLHVTPSLDQLARVAVDTNLWAIGIGGLYSLKSQCRFPLFCVGSQ